MTCLKDAQDALCSSKLTSSELRDALSMRLKFRIAFLTAVSLADQRDKTLSRDAWDELVSFLPGVSTSRELSKPVPDSFSVKLQRKLASTVPPRPVVTIAFEAAYKHLERLCHDGRALTEVLNYYDSHSLMVCIELLKRSNYFTANQAPRHSLPYSREESHSPQYISAHYYSSTYSEICWYLGRCRSDSCSTTTYPALS
jgi:hypothetical protein